MNKSLNKSYVFLFQWVVIAFFSAIIGTLSVQLVLFLYRVISGALVRVSIIPFVLWPVAGAAVVGLIIYRIEPHARGEGIPSYIVGMRDHNGALSLSQTIFKFLAAVITLGTFGNGGFVGPVGRVSAGLMAEAGRIIPEKLISERHKSLYPVCGMAAAFAALIHSPVGAGVFAVEIIQKSSMRYRHLFPAILSATLSVVFSRVLGFQPLFRINAAEGDFNLAIAGILVLVSIAAGLEGRGFTFLYALISRLFHRNKILSYPGVVLRAIAGTALAILLTFLINPAISGTSNDVLQMLLEGNFDLLYGNLSKEVPLFLVILILVLVKAAANSLTVGSGMSAGFAGPAMLLGLLCGAFFAVLFNIQPGTPEYFALLAAGFAGVFSSSMNTPIAVSILTIELFGMYYCIPAGFAAVAGFQLNRHHTLYDMVFEEEEDEIW